MARSSLKDRRSRFTKKEIKSAYIRLLDKETDDKITVTQICKEADINRGTFYLHYETLEDVWKDIEDDLIRDSEMIFENGLYDPKGIDPATHFEHIKTSDIWAKVFFGPNASLNLYKKIEELGANRLIEAIPEGTFENEEMARVYAHFVVGGCNAVEQDRFDHPWEDFDKTNSFYNSLMESLTRKFIGKYKTAKKGDRKQ